MAYGSNPFNTLVPFFPNVDTTPAYLEDTTTRVTSENFYWANRIIAALCDGAFRSTSNAVERYQEKTGAMGHRLVAATDEQIARLGLTAAEEAAQSAAEEEFEADNVDGDVQPMTPDETIAALRNPRCARFSPPPTRPWPTSSRRKPKSCLTPCCTLAAWK